LLVQNIGMDFRPREGGRFRKGGGKTYFTGPDISAAWSGIRGKGGIRKSVLTRGRRHSTHGSGESEGERDFKQLHLLDTSCKRVGARFERLVREKGGKGRALRKLGLEKKERKIVH